jgi:hypothetical protein
MTPEQKSQIITILNLHAVNNGNGHLVKGLVLEMEKAPVWSPPDMSSKIKTVAKTVREHAKESAEDFKRK